MNDMKTSGDRTGWFRAVAETVMDGGAMPLSMLIEKVPRKLPTARNDGHVTAGQVLGEKRRADYQAGWQIIVEEIVQILADQGFVDNSDGMVRWLKPLNGVWQVNAAGIDRTLWGQRERRLSRDRDFLGERNEKDGSTTGLSLVEREKAKAMEVEIIGPRGKSEFKAFQVHPFALAIPPMTEKERENLRADIAQHGVKMPLWLYPDGDDLDGHKQPRIKVLDGRHRLYYASLLKKPIRVEMFEGTEKEARNLVSSLNLKRRHLTPAQVNMVAVKLFGEEAKKEAKEHQKGGQGGVLLRDISPEANPGKWHERVAQKAGGQAAGVSVAGVRNIMPVFSAPQTMAKVERGEIHTVTQANREAKAEIAEAEGREPEPPMRGGDGTISHSIRHRLGVMRGQAQTILENPDLKLGGPGSELILEDIENMIPRIRAVLFVRGVIIP